MQGFVCSPLRDGTEGHGGDAPQSLYNLLAILKDYRKWKSSYPCMPVKCTSHVQSCAILSLTSFCVTALRMATVTTPTRGMLPRKLSKKAWLGSKSN